MICRRGSCGWFASGYDAATVNRLPALFIGLVMTAMTQPLCADDATGASRAWTSEAPKIVQARHHVLKGEFSKAESILGDSDAPDETEMREIVRRLRREYPLDQSELLKKLKPSLPDVT
jgi:hypothetical protein